jgi:DNA-binding PadR family transcriptional regulator
MAQINTAAREELVQFFVSMFSRFPTANQLAYANNTNMACAVAHEDLRAVQTSNRKETETSLSGVELSEVVEQYRSDPLQHVQIVTLHTISTGSPEENYITLIAERVGKVLQKEYTVPHMASVLERLADKDLLKAETVQPKEGGRARRYYKMTQKGKVALVESHRVIYRPLDLIQKLMAIA